MVPREVGAVQVALVHLRLEARGGEQRGDVAAEVAAAGDAAPGGLQARLPGAHARVGGAAVFGEKQLAVRLEHAAHLGERGGGVGDGAQRIGAHDAVEAGVGRGQGLGGERHQRHGQARLAAAAQGERVHRGAVLAQAGVHAH